MAVKIKYCILILSLFSIINCGSYNNKLLKENSKLVTNKYLSLIKESDKFLSQPKQENFIKKLNLYINNCKEYNFKDGREPSVFLSPAIIDEKYNRVFTFILERSKGISGDRIEYIHFISAKYSNNQWDFKLKKGHGFSFSYYNNGIKTSTNENLAKEAIRNLMLMGYFKENIIFDESLFKSDWYTLK